MGQNAKTEFKWAVIATILGVLLLIILKVTGFRIAENFDTGHLIDVIGTIIIMGFAYYKGIGEKKANSLGSVMTYAQGFWTGAIITLLLIPLNAFVTWFYTCCIDPGFIENVATITKSDIGLGHILKQMCIMLTIIGLVYSLIIPLFLRTKD